MSPLNRGDTSIPVLCLQVKYATKVLTEENVTTVVDINQVSDQLEAIRKRAREFEEDPQLVRNILQEGSEAARDVAEQTMDEVRAAIGLNY